MHTRQALAFWGRLRCVEAYPSCKESSKQSKNIHVHLMSFNFMFCSPWYSRGLRHEYHAGHPRRNGGWRTWLREHYPGNNVSSISREFLHRCRGKELRGIPFLLCLWLSTWAWGRGWVSRFQREGTNAWWAHRLRSCLDRRSTSNRCRCLQEARQRSGNGTKQNGQRKWPRRAEIQELLVIHLISQVEFKFRHLKAVLSDERPLLVIGWLVVGIKLQKRCFLCGSLKPMYFHTYLLTDSKRNQEKLKKWFKYALPHSSAFEAKKYAWTMSFIFQSKKETHIAATTQISCAHLNF